MAGQRLLHRREPQPEGHPPSPAPARYARELHAGGSLDSYDYWPNVLFDTREGLLRDVDPNDGRPTLGGLMNYIELDVKNLSLWFKCAAPYNAGVCSGNQVITNNGYSVYFSDRRGNVNPGPFSGPANPANVDGANLESGEYGFEDFVNPTTAAGTPSSTLDGGEDVNANGQLDTYGEFPSSVNALNAATANSLPAGGTGLYAPANISAAVVNANPVQALELRQLRTSAWSIEPTCSGAR